MKIEKEIIFKKIFVYCIYIIIAIGIFYNIIFSINTTIFQKDYLQLFGISLFKMDSDLMQEDINFGDLVIIKKVNADDLQEGSIIAYSVNGKTRINKIVKIKKEGYITKFNKNYNPDIEIIQYNQIIGEKAINISNLGFTITVLQSKITTAWILILFVIWFLYNKYIFAKKQERINKKKNLRRDR